MGYSTGRASFASDLQDDAFWLYTRDDGVVNACSTNAAGLALAVRAALGLAQLPAWDSSLVAALRARAAELAVNVPAWTDVRDRLATGTGVSRLAVLFAIYLAYYEPNGMRFDAIALPDSADMPTLGASIGGEPQAVACWNPTREPDPSRADADRDGVATQSVYGIRLHPGDAAPVRHDNGSPYAGPSDTAVMLGVGLAIAFAVWLFTTAPERK